jgi:hypothetical protein
MWSNGVQLVDKAAVPALIGEMADWLARERHADGGYNGVTLCEDDEPIYLSIEAMSTAIVTGVLHQVGHHLSPEEFALIYNERALRSIIVLAEVNSHANDGGPRLP